LTGPASSCRNEVVLASNDGDQEDITIAGLAPALTHRHPHADHENNGLSNGDGHPLYRELQLVLSPGELKLALRLELLVDRCAG
jgi:hypothetical protein